MSGLGPFARARARGGERAVGDVRCPHCHELLAVSVGVTVAGRAAAEHQHDWEYAAPDHRFCKGVDCRAQQVLGAEADPDSDRVWWDVPT